MEDRHLLACPLPGSESGSGSGSGSGPGSADAGQGGGAHLLGVFDGHRGAAAAEFAAEQLLGHLRGAWGAPSAEAALQRAFVGLDAAFRGAQVGAPVPADCVTVSCARSVTMSELTARSVTMSELTAVERLGIIVASCLLAHTCGLLDSQRWQTRVEC